MTSQVLLRTIFSTARSCRISRARDCVRASRGKNRPEYGSSLSSMIRSRSRCFSSSKIAASGSSGSGLVATMPQYRSTSALAFHEGNSTLSLNDWHASGLICSANDFGVRVEVDPGSKPLRDGVTRAFRFCVMESSIEDRDRRKKSEACQRAQFPSRIIDSAR